MKLSVLLSLLMVSLFTSLLLADGETRLLRFPATNGKQIVFSYAGDLYSVAMNGGVARKLTTHEGYEMFPRFSNDGEWLAFTGQYDGNTEVFLMSGNGGVPKRLTYTATLGRDDVSDRMGPNNLVVTWKNKSKEIVFRSRMISYNSFIGQLFSVGIDGDISRQVPVPRGGFCSFSADDSKMAYNRIFREFRTWKRYRGGMADDVWVYDFNTKKAENVTNNPAQDIIPMWAGNKIFFLSDRDDSQRMNLFSYDLTTKQTVQHTNYTDYDIKFPSLGNGHIVFENGGYIYDFNIAAGSAQKVTISILEDFRSGRGGLKELADQVDQSEISPDGKRALFGAHGELFTVPAEHGPTRNLTNSSGAHDRNMRWSPDGKWIAYVSDASGENEIHITAQDGSGSSRQLTKGADAYYYQPYWSPDSKKIMWSDNMLRLRYVDVASGKVTTITNAPNWEIRQYAWSPDSKWVTYAQQENSGVSRVYVYSVDSGKSQTVTDEWFDANSPAFSNDGKYLLFASSRDFNPVYSWTEWNHAYQDMERVYLVTLASDIDSPFKPKTDEVSLKQEEVKKDKKGKKDKKDEESEEKTVSVKIDFAGIGDRVIGLPIPPGGYGGISCIDGKVYYNRNTSKEDGPSLYMYDLEKQEEKTIGKYGGYEISADNKKMLIISPNKYAIVDLPSSEVKLEKTLDLSGMEMVRDRHAEWRQIFDECWRQMRDFLYAPNLHGVDWPAVRAKYAALLPYVNHRNDLSYIIGEMIGELNVGHAYVGGGDRPDVERIQMGLLGAQLERDAQSRFYKIARVLDGENWAAGNRSPLNDIGVNVKAGDYILAVDGNPVNNMDNIYHSLINTAGKQVVLTVNSKPSTQGSREVTVVPISDESSLYYYNWVQKNIDYVTEKTGGKVGYLHVPDMGVGGLNEFVKHFYPQIRKKALIIDVRGNGGGNVSPMLIERLRREVVMTDMSRNTPPRPDPAALINGPLLCMLDEFSASDGDLFPYRFKAHKLGKLVGKRSWGGVVGIRGSLPLLDGGTLHKPEFASYDLEGRKWIIEGYGVEPDIEVENEPGKEFAGEDQQLDRAIVEILKDLQTQEKTTPAIPPYPDRSKIKQD